MDRSTRPRLREIYAGPTLPGDPRAAAGDGRPDASEHMVPFLVFDRVPRSEDLQFSAVQPANPLPAGRPRRVFEGRLPIDAGTLRRFHVIDECDITPDGQFAFVLSGGGKIAFGPGALKRATAAEIAAVKVNGDHLLPVQLADREHLAFDQFLLSREDLQALTAEHCPTYRLTGDGMLVARQA